MTDPSSLSQVDRIWSHMQTNDHRPEFPNPEASSYEIEEVKVEIY